MNSFRIQPRNAIPAPAPKPRQISSYANKPPHAGQDITPLLRRGKSGRAKGNNRSLTAEAVRDDSKSQSNGDPSPT